MSKPEKSTLRLVAARAGVSPATASRTLNGNSSVDKELARRVFAAAQELGYQFSGPSKGKNSITFIAPAIASTYFSYTVTGVIEEAREALLQKRSRQEHQIAQATMARALNRLRVKNMGIGR